jgi:hypothetical protein
MPNYFVEIQSILWESRSRARYIATDGTDPTANNITWANVFKEIANHLLKPGSF